RIRVGATDVTVISDYSESSTWWTVELRIGAVSLVLTVLLDPQTNTLLLIGLETSDAASAGLEHLSAIDIAGPVPRGERIVQCPMCKREGTVEENGKTHWRCRECLHVWRK